VTEVRKQISAGCCIHFVYADFVINDLGPGFDSYRRHIRFGDGGDQGGMGIPIPHKYGIIFIILSSILTRLHGMIISFRLKKF